MTTDEPAAPATEDPASRGLSYANGLAAHDDTAHPAGVHAIEVQRFSPIGRRVAVLVAFALLACVLPLAGARLTGGNVIEHASFDWRAFALYAVLIAAAIAPFVRRLARTDPVAVPMRAAAFAVHTSAFPWWGWLGLALTAIAWVLAWTRFASFTRFQLYTFTPLWLGYILVINAAAYRRSRHCLLADRPRCFLALFPASALFWWYFEYLNRYVGNWRYVGVESVGTIEYIFHATVSFSTVLPAVLSTRDWLATFPRLRTVFTGWPLADAQTKPFAAFLLALGVLGFLGVGAFPHYLYAMVWVAPVLVLTALAVLTGAPSLVDRVPRGDWTAIGLAAVAALVCGFFWEMWNWRSLAHWEYRIPLVHGLLVFEMPLLGYAGYLPFGVACAAVAALVCRSARDATA
ncbi:MAG: hypothetical protein ACJ8NR_01650 [Sulfurifustis sp.]